MIKIETEFTLVPSATHIQSVMYNAWRHEQKMRDADPDMRGHAIDVFAGWATYLGITVDPSSLGIAVTFTEQTFGELTLTDLTQAIILFTGRKLPAATDDDYKFQIGINPLFIGKVLSLYIDYRKHELHAAKQKILRVEQSTKREPTPEERVALFQGTLVIAFSESMKGVDYDDFGSILFDFIKRNKLIDIEDKQLINAAVRYGNELQQKEWAAKERKQSLSALTNRVVISEIFGQTPESARRKYSRVYVVNLWLKKMYESIELLPEEIPAKKSRINHQKAIETALQDKRINEINKFINSITIEMIIDPTNPNDEKN